MKPIIRTPYFEVGTKNYVYGDQLLEYAIAADKAAEKYDIDVLFICPALEVRRVAENTKHLFVLATYMDTLRPGRGCADILPEGLKAAGAVGVMINHCEKPMSLPQMKKTIDRARELDFLVFACADTLDEAKAIAQLMNDAKDCTGCHVIICHCQNPAGAERLRTVILEQTAAAEVEILDCHGLTSFYAMDKGLIISY